jgi:hypothetical protein
MNRVDINCDIGEMPKAVADFRQVASGIVFQEE